MVQSQNGDPSEKLEAVEVLSEEVAHRENVGSLQHSTAPVMEIAVNRKTHIEAAGGLHIWHLVVAHSWTALLM